MAEKKVSVLITAKDGVTSVLRGTTAGLKNWSRDVTKIFAGIGLADSAKEIGRFIRDSIKLAADSYPKLGAGLTQLSDGFREFRIQAGAAFLEVLQPAVPILKSVLDWATRLAQQLPDAFDGVLIVFAQISGWFRALPSVAQEAFGHVAEGAATLIEKLPAFLRLRIGLGAPDALRAAGARLVEEGVAGQKGVDTETAARVSELANRRHDFGTRAQTEAERKAAEEAREARIRAGVRQAEVDIRGAGGPQVVGGRDVQTRSSGLGGVAEGELPQTLEDTTAGALSLHEALSLVTEVTPAVAEGLDAINNSLLGSIPGFGLVAKAAQKAVQIIAKVEGAVAIAKGAVKIAESIWPFNPAGLKSGLLMVTEGTRLAALGGGGGGGSHGGGGGGLGSSRFERDQAALAAARNRPPTIVLQKGFIRTDDPDFQDFIRAVAGNSQDRS